MGWWNLTATDNTIGDGPLESLEGAIADVVAQYQEAFHRRPTKAEWESLLHAVLGSATSDERVTDEGIVEKVHIELRK
jgi:hypothetical protein